MEKLDLRLKVLFTLGALIPLSMLVMAFLPIKAGMIIIDVNMIAFAGAALYNIYKIFSFQDFVEASVNQSKEFKSNGRKWVGRFVYTMPAWVIFGFFGIAVCITGMVLTIIN